MKFLLIGVALIAGLSRDIVMVIIFKAAAEIESPTFYLTWLPLFVGGLVVFIGTSYAYRVLVRAVTTRIANTVKMRLVRNLLHAQPPFLLKRGHGALYHIMTEDVQRVSGFSGVLLDMLPSIIFLCVAGPQIFFLSPIAGVFAVFVMIGGVYSYYRQRLAVEKGASNIRRLEIKYFEHVSDVINGFTELKLHVPRKRDLVEHTTETTEKHRDTAVFVEKRYSMGDMFVQILKYTLFGGILFAVPYYSDEGTTLVFQLVTVILFTIGPFESIVSQYPAFVGTKVAFSRTTELDEALNQYVRPDDENTAPLLFEQYLTIKDMAAHHGARETSDFVLGPIDFTLHRGEVIYIIGSNGSGKTTFLNVLAGLHDPDKGELIVDDRPVGTDAMGRYRAMFTSVFTKFHLFRILYGLKDVSEKEILDSLSQAQLEGVSEVKNAEFTRIDLSSGQRRRLALAVALMEQRDILILDEFISDQDPERRRYFFEDLVPALKGAGKTLIVTTHNLQWINSCDRLLTFDDGKVQSIRYFRDGVEIDEEQYQNGRSVIAAETLSSSAK